MIFHIPHSSCEIPYGLRDSILLDDQALYAELLAMTDAYTGDFFGFHAGPSDEVITFPVSRLIVDPERFVDDSIEAMSNVGMGVIYERTSGGDLLRSPPTPDERQRLTDRYYKPHHEKLTIATEQALSNQGRALIVDCHSFPSSPLPYEVDQRLDRPDICIGTDEYHTPRSLISVAEEAVQDEILSCEVNRPFAGSIVPARYFNRDPRASSIMIEVNRSLYMDEATGERSGAYEKCRASVGRILAKIRVADIDMRES